MFLGGMVAYGMRCPATVIKQGFAIVRSKMPPQPFVESADPVRWRSRVVVAAKLAQIVGDTAGSQYQHALVAQMAG
jgi:hypothetical protein